MNVKPNKTMKTWEIKITAKTEGQAARYLKNLMDGMEIANDHRLPLDGMYIENGEEILKCQMIKNEQDEKK